MTQNMFCFQCEQTAGGKGCTGCAGVCGKKADTAHLQDELTGALIMLASQARENGAENAAIDKLILDGLFSTLTNVNFNNETVKQMTEAVHSETLRIGGEVNDYDMKKIWEANEDVRSLNP